MSRFARATVTGLAAYAGALVGGMVGERVESTAAETKGLGACVGALLFGAVAGATTVGDAKQLPPAKTGRDPRWL